MSVENTCEERADTTYPTSLLKRSVTMSSLHESHRRRLECARLPANAMDALGHRHFYPLCVHSAPVLRRATTNTEERHYAVVRKEREECRDEVKVLK
jgi:hypothetical protein